MKTTDILKSIEFWCKNVKACDDFSMGFYKGSLNSLQALDLITEETFEKYTEMLNDKYIEKYNDR